MRKVVGGWIVAGENWGQDLLRENAALESTILNIHGVIAKSFARIHFENLVNFSVVPLRLADLAVHDQIDSGYNLTVVGDIVDQINHGADTLTLSIDDDRTFDVRVDLTADQRETVVAGGKLAALQTEDG